MAASAWPSTAPRSACRSNTFRPKAMAASLRPGLRRSALQRTLPRFLAAHPISGSLRLHVRSAIPSHAGLGSGTQLALAVGTALARLAGLGLDAPRTRPAPGPWGPLGHRHRHLPDGGVGGGRWPCVGGTWRTDAARDLSSRISRCVAFCRRHPGGHGRAQQRRRKAGIPCLAVRTGRLRGEDLPPPRHAIAARARRR